MSLTVKDYEAFVKSLAGGLGCQTTLPEIAAAIGTIRAKAKETDAFRAKVKRDAEVLRAILPTQADLEDLRRGLSVEASLVSERLDKARMMLAALMRAAMRLE